MNGAEARRPLTQAPLREGGALGGALPVSQHPGRGKEPG